MDQQYPSVSRQADTLEDGWQRYELEVHAVTGEPDSMNHGRIVTDAVVDSEQSLRLQLHLEQPGYAVIALEAAGDSHWQEQGRESVVLRLELNGQYQQDVILFYGDRALDYVRLLGCLPAGTHTITIMLQREMTPQRATRAVVRRAGLYHIGYEQPLALVYRHTPVIYGRQLTHPYESTFTDTPLLLLYSLEQRQERTVIEYHLVFSHEDEGTPSGLLMSKWGRTTDIEWMHRLELDGDGTVLRHTYQGPQHVETAFAGHTACGGHPVLQAATANGNFTDVPVSDYRYMLPPLLYWDRNGEPRERVMVLYPFIHQVSNWEMNRQYELEQPVNRHSWKLADQRHYLFIHGLKQWLDSVNDESQTELPIDEVTGENISLLRQTCIDYQLRLKGEQQWLSSSYFDLRIGTFRAAYEGPYPGFATTIKTDKQLVLDDIAAIRAVLLPGGLDEVQIGNMYAYTLDEQYQPVAGITVELSVVLTTAEPTALLWSNDRLDT
ncbi:hypothetical protein [Paenibacillus campi]|uniref:hypothetical protein n=1 Tax=Paenibacillus campi TaxID=3106031 RepID=UPI002AFFDDF5|nr:hypothetical protein [Paenibacillus sp. SGZ-1009]